MRNIRLIFFFPGIATGKWIDYNAEDLSHRSCVLHCRTISRDMVLSISAFLVEIKKEC